MQFQLLFTVLTEKSVVDCVASTTSKIRDSIDGATLVASEQPALASCAILQQAVGAYLLLAARI